MIAEQTTLIYVEQTSRRFSRGAQHNKSAIPHSAATSAGYSGTDFDTALSQRVYIPGEGWVYWHELEAQFNAAFRRFWLLRALKLPSLTRRAELRAAATKPNPAGEQPESNHKESLAARIAFSAVEAA